MPARSAKQLAQAAVDGLPEDATIEDVMERLAFLAEIECGLADAEAGRTIPHDEILARFPAPSGERQAARVGPVPVRWIPKAAPESWCVMPQRLEE